MKRIVIIGANSFQNPLILKAKEMGFETHVFAWKDGSIGEKTADFFYPISIVEKEKILSICRRINPDAVITIASDLANVTVQYLCDQLNLPHNSQNTLYVTTNKYAMRNALKENNLLTPQFMEISASNKITEDMFKHFKFPLIVKPTDRSGSRGIFKVNSLQELHKVIDESINLSLEKKAIVEEFIDGEEYSCECITQNKKHYCLAVTKKFTTGAPHFIETGHIEPSGLNASMISRITNTVFKSLDALGVEVGPSHTEFKIDNSGEVRIIEIGSRMGGDCIGSDLVQLSTGYDFVKMTIEASLGKSISFERQETTNCVGIRFIFDDNDLEVYKKLKEKDAIVRFSGIESDMKEKVVDSSTRKGFFIFTCDTYSELKYWMELMRV